MTNRPGLLNDKDRRMMSKLNELLPEYRAAFSKVIDKHWDIKKGIKRLKYDAEKYNKFKEKMRIENVKLV